MQFATAVMLIVQSAVELHFLLDEEESSASSLYFDSHQISALNILAFISLVCGSSVSSILLITFFFHFCCNTPKLVFNTQQRPSLNQSSLNNIISGCDSPSSYHNHESFFIRHPYELCMVRLVHVSTLFSFLGLLTQTIIVCIACSIF